MGGILDCARGENEQEGIVGEVDQSRCRPRRHVQNLRPLLGEQKARDGQIGGRLAPVIGLHDRDKNGAAYRAKPFRVAPVTDPTAHAPAHTRADGVEAIHPPELEVVHVEERAALVRVQAAVDEAGRLRGSVPDAGRGAAGSAVQLFLQTTLST